MSEHIDKTNKKYNQYSRPYPKWAIDAMDEVLKLQGARRWRASAALAINLNPVDPEDGLTAKEQYAESVKIAHEKRQNLKTKFGEIDAGTEFSGKTGMSASTVRDQVIMPAQLWHMIKMFDPTAFDKSNPDAKTNLNKLRLEFKELSVAEKF